MTTTSRTQLSPPSRSAATLTLLVAAGGFVAQMIAGVTDTPTIPPGLVVIVVAAAVVAFSSWQLAPLIAVAASVFNLVAFVAVGAVDRLDETSPVLGFVGTWLMLLALIIAGVAGALATLTTRHTSTEPPSAAAIQRRDGRYDC